MAFTLVIRSSQGKEINLLGPDPFEMHQIVNDIFGRTIPDPEMKEKAIKKLQERFPNYLFEFKKVSQ